MAEVSIVHCEKYDMETAEAALLQVLEPLGGLDWVKSGMRVAIKANLVSINVDRLVQEGLLARCEVAHDRRKVELKLTEKAAPIVEKGHAVQAQFSDTLL